MKNVGALQITIASEREIVMTRSFDAPRHLVFEAYTRPELVKRWLGAFGGWSFDVCEIDLRVGGRFRYVWRHVDGQEMGMSGVYLEVLPPARIVNTEVFDQAWYDGEAQETVELVEKDGTTTLTATVRYASQAVRDAVLQSPMETGVAASYDKLEEVLAASLAQANA